MNTQIGSVKGQRIAAFIIDSFIISFGIFIVIIIYSITNNSIMIGTNERTLPYIGYLFSTILLFLLFFSYYTLLPYFTKGFTLGKLVAGIKIISIDYTKSTFIQLLKRNFYLFEIVIIFGFSFLVSLISLNQSSFLIVFLLFTLINFFISLIIFIMIIATEEGVGFHDLFAKTFVVTKNFDINNLTRINPVERNQMSWAIFDDDPIIKPTNIKKGEKSNYNDDEDQIEILRKKD